MIQTPAIVTFANQKGGVGKTTLCVTFANYLVAKGVRVVIIDCDFQHSILKCRKADLKKYGEELVPYEIWAYEPDNKEAMTSLIEKLHNDPELDVVLMDSPGSLHAEGLVPMFVNSDIIVVPFHYDLVTIPSTASFLLFLDRLRQAVGEGMNAQLFIIPNLNDNLSYANGISSAVTAHFKVEQLSGQFISFGYGSLRYGLFLQLLDVVGECFCIFARNAAFLVDFCLILRCNLLQRVNGFFAFSKASGVVMHNGREQFNFVLRFSRCFCALFFKFQAIGLYFFLQPLLAGQFFGSRSQQIHRPDYSNYSGQHCSIRVGQHGGVQFHLCGA